MQYPSRQGRNCQRKIPEWRKEGLRRYLRRKRDAIYSPVRNGYAPPAPTPPPFRRVHSWNLLAIPGRLLATDAESIGSIARRRNACSRKMLPGPAEARARTHICSAGNVRSRGCLSTAGRPLPRAGPRVGVPEILSACPSRSGHTPAGWLSSSNRLQRGVVPRE